MKGWLKTQVAGHAELEKLFADYETLSLSKDFDVKGLGTTFEIKQKGEQAAKILIQGSESRNSGVQKSQNNAEVEQANEYADDQVNEGE